MNRSSYYFKLPFIILLIAGLQRSQLGTLTIQGVHPDLLLAGAIVIGLIEGREAGAIAGFVFGLIADSFASIPFGVSSLVYATIGYCVGLVEVTSMPDSLIAEVLISLVGGAVGVAFLEVVVRILGLKTTLSAKFSVALIVVAAVCGIFSLIGVPLFRWLINLGSGDRPPSRRSSRSL
ncbi:MULTISPECIES: rod shape-determining protein MreD [Acidithrix]|uniref:Rod shape-determining protein MreD n=1 Tax=Acidithrix ferrooxidans TaxID=1280514 RepID=A0A0D8HP30_9ACTN|nr:MULTISPECIES: rod shape-determining protein MreD [Acidithrix]KJF18866.1 rod shape-determining protein MreD [Acidithrix ferrooxidans]